MHTAKINNARQESLASSPEPSNTTPTQDIATIYREIKRGPFIGFPTSFLALTGGNHKAALLLHHIVYMMCEVNKNLEYYYREQSVLGAVIGLSKKEMQRALNVLKDRQLLTTSCHLVKRKKTTFYYPFWPVIRTRMFDYWEGTPDDVEKDKKALSKKPAEKDKKVLREVYKKVLPLERTKGQLLNSSSEVASSQRPSLIRKHANRNGSTINDGLQQYVEGSAEQQPNVTKFMTLSNEAPSPPAPEPYFETLKDGRGILMDPNQYPVDWK